MRSANLFGPLKGLCPHKALIGLTQASGLAGGFDLPYLPHLLADDPADGIRGVLLHLGRGVGVGVQREARRVVAQGPR